MRRPLRGQLLIPLTALVGAAVVINAAAAVWLTTVRQERAADEQLRQVARTLTAASFPLTPSVLERLKDLTGAEVVVWEASSETTSVTTLPSPPPAGWWPATVTAGESAILTLDGVTYRGIEASTAQRRLFLLRSTIEERREQSAAAWPAILVGAATLCLLIPLTDLLARRFVSRIHRVQEKVAAVATGDYTPLTQTGVDDELRALTQGVNEMSARIAALQARTERDERARLLTQFSGGLAHHLRNAVAGARMAVEIHQHRCPGGTVDDSLLVALRQLTLIEQQVRGVLALGGKSRSLLTEVDLVPLTRGVVELVEPTAKHTQVQLTLQLPESPLIATVDADGLRAALSNLLLNACEAAGPGGTVGCRLSANATEMTWEIRDTGSGPPEVIAADLATPFVTGKPDGVGLGLAFARQLAEDHQGRLEWSRENDETCFRWVLPRSRTDAPPMKDFK